MNLKQKVRHAAYSRDKCEFFPFFSGDMILGPIQGIPISQSRSIELHEDLRRKIPLEERPSNVLG